ncbi:hypothetical protein DPMN_158176 [Dreissena polymorpha]|uniref:Uncharacterized protein n=1 Tax=Dreissena polymorpha TaxID=45954 RepID=A0A9D4IQN8_DREPO|nr:hypothetical protein DPMN_158176 [Dreissena polymorpha]
MKNTCEKEYGWYNPWRYGCMSLAVVYYKAVRAFSEGAYQVPSKWFSDAPWVPACV